ncbi:MAG: DUF853 family protein [Holophagales bacterium]|nr:DUF853 family protein [Holophagales bacterium]
MANELFLGRSVTKAPAPLALDPDDLMTHGLIVGMTGSGKTALGILLIEELLKQGIPVLAIDPKGDLGNLALAFPRLAPDEFAPWVPAGGEATPEGEAKKWSEGLARGDHRGRRRRIRRLARRHDLHPRLEERSPGRPPRRARAAARRRRERGGAGPDDRLPRRAPRPPRARRRPGLLPRVHPPGTLRRGDLGQGRDGHAGVARRRGGAAAVRGDRRAAARDVLPEEGARRPGPRPQRPPRLAGDVRLPRRRAARHRRPPRRGPGAGEALHLLDRAPLRPRAALRRRDASLSRPLLAPLAARLHVLARADLHRRDLRVLPAVGRAADEEASPLAPQAGPRVRRRHRARHAEPGRPRLQGALELRLLVGRDAPDRARPATPRRRPHRRRRADRRRRPPEPDEEEDLSSPRRPPEGAGDLRDPLGDELPARPDDARRADEAEESGAGGARVLERCRRRRIGRRDGGRQRRARQRRACTADSAPPRARPCSRPSGPPAGSTAAGAIARRPTSG